MASKFQNRLVGSLILVAVGVIVLPSLLDGEKRHYEEQFASIPLVPKEGDEQEIDLLPPVTQPLSSQPDLPPVQEPPAANTPQTEVPATEGQREGVTALPVEPSVKEEPQPVERAPVVSPPPVDEKSDKKPIAPPAETTPRKDKSAIETKESEPRERAPTGAAYVIQLGALKNATKVEEIVAKLRLSGYRVYTVPSKAVSGELTRIYVGPNVSKEALEGQLTELKALSGLNGQVRGYKP